MEQPTTYPAKKILQAANEGAIWVDLSTMGRLEASQRDRLDLPNRLSTNKVDTLSKGEGRATVFTTAIGRVIDRVIILNCGEKAIYITSPHRAERISQWLNRNVFFNDEFQLTDLSQTWAQLGVMGEHSIAVLKQWLGELHELPYYAFTAANPTDAQSDDGLLVVRIPEIIGDTFWMVGRRPLIEDLTSKLNAAGVLPADADTYDYLRIQRGIPGVNELTEDHIPLELGLWEDVSFNKGCYIGQEIIARMESRGKLARMLVSVQSPAPLAPGTPLLNAAGTSIGTITSSSILASPDDNHHPGLAMVKAAFANQETELYAKTEEATISLTLRGLAGSYTITR